MASSKEYVTYVLELLREVPGISYRKMMGECIFYKDGIVFGGVYDNRFLVKKTKSLLEYNFKEQIPYPGGSNMYLIDSEDPDFIKEIVDLLYLDLKPKGR